MKLNKTGKLARLYRWTYGKAEMPNNLCPYFWKVLLAIIVFPITWLSYAWGFRVHINGTFWDAEFDESNKMYLNYASSNNMFFKRFFTGLLLAAFLILFSSLVGTFLSEDNLSELIYAFIINILFYGIGVILICGSVIGAVYCGFWTKDKIKKSETYQETVSIIKERKEGFKESYCPRISWTSEDNEKV